MSSTIVRKPDTAALRIIDQAIMKGIHISNPQVFSENVAGLSSMVGSRAVLSEEVILTELTGFQAQFILDGLGTSRMLPKERNMQRVYLGSGKVSFLHEVTNDWVTLNRETLLIYLEFLFRVGMKNQEALEWLQKNPLAIMAMATICTYVLANFPRSAFIYSDRELRVLNSIIKFAICVKPIDFTYDEFKVKIMHNYLNLVNNLIIMGFKPSLQLVEPIKEMIKAIRLVGLDAEMCELVSKTNGGLATELTTFFTSPPTVEGHDFHWKKGMLKEWMKLIGYPRKVMQSQKVQLGDLVWAGSLGG